MLHAHAVEPSADPQDLYRAYRGDLARRERGSAPYYSAAQAFLRR